MAIDEAIFKLTIAKDGFPTANAESFYIALELGIEALKRVRDYKKAHVGLHYTPMPGETEE